MAIGDRLHGAGQHVVLADEPGDEGIARLAVERVRRTLLHHPAIMEHRDAVGHRQRLALVVRDIDDRQAEPFVQQLDLDLHLLAQLLVERTERLVHQHEARLEHQRARQRDALLLPAGELRRATLGECLKPHHRQRTLHALRRFRARGMRRTLSGKATFSPTVMCGNSA